MAASTPHPASETSFINPADPLTRIPFPTLDRNPTIDLSVIVPAYNEEQRLPIMLEETLPYLEKRRNSTKPFSYELIIVDDGSRDRTADVALEFVAKYSTEHVRVLRLIKNAGKGGAVRRGMLSARGRHLLMADADAATIFDDLEQLERAVEGGADVAIGSRAHLRDAKPQSSRKTTTSPAPKSSLDSREGKGRDPLRSFVSFVFNLLVIYIAGVVGLRDTQCGFKLYSRKAARVAFEGQHLDRWAFDIENLYRVQKVGMKVVEVPVRWTEVPGSKLSVVKATINMAWDMLRMRYHYVSGAWTVPSLLSS